MMLLLLIGAVSCQPLDFAAKSKPVGVIDVAETTPWKNVLEDLGAFKACEYEQVKVRNVVVSLRESDTVVVVDKKAKLVDGGTVVDFSLKDIDALKVARDASDALGIAALDATPLKLVLEWGAALNAAGFSSLAVSTNDLGKHAALATALGRKIAEGATEKPLSPALVTVFAKAQQLGITSSTAPGWTGIEASVCTYEGHPVVWGVGETKRTNGDLDWPTADNRARSAIAKLMGVDEIRGSRVLDHWEDTKTRKSLVQLDAPDALKAAATGSCPTSAAVVKWASRAVSVKDLPKPSWSKAGVSYRDGVLSAKVDAPDDARLAAEAGARTLLTATIGEAALTVAKKLSAEQRACLAELPWSEAFAKVQIEAGEGAWLNVYELRKLGKKCTEAITSVIKEAAAPHACVAGKKVP